MGHPSIIELTAAACFFVAILHTFSVSYFQRLATRYREGSVGENVFHLLGEVEVVFGVWAGIFLALYALIEGRHESIHYLESRNFTEPLLVFVIMTICASRPVLEAAESLIHFLSKAVPLPKSAAFFATTMTVGPLIGSFITEPAAMTVVALILLKKYFSHPIPTSLKYAILGTLFVNVSIGGTLTPYAAPPVLMVAGVWNWDLQFMLTHFGWKAALTVPISTSLILVRFWRPICSVPFSSAEGRKIQTPWWVILLHLLILAGVVINHHHAPVFFGLFLFFLGVATVTREYQTELKLREALLVAFFLAGLVVLGGMQRFWLEPILSRLEVLTLYWGAISLTAVTDNAALTYLGSQVPGLSDLSKYALVAGSVVGGGLTVIANAPNPAGYGILNPAFGPTGISALRLFFSALIPTLVAAALFWPF